MEKWRRISIVSYGFLESLLFSGCLFGWASLLHVLQQEGVYSKLCGNDESRDVVRNATVNVNSGETEDILMAGPQFNNLLDEFEEIEIWRCKSQEKSLGLIYTVASVMYGLSAILTGFSLDYLGLWVTRISGSLLTVGGFLCLAYTNMNSSWLLWPALNLLAVGTNQLRLSTFQFANCWPERRSTILLMYSGAYSISTLLFLLFQKSYQLGISHVQNGIFLAILAGLTIVPNLLLPKMKIEDHLEPIPTEDPDYFIPTLREKDELNSKHSTKRANVKGNEGEDSSLMKIPLRASLFTLSAVLHLLWHFINLFLVLFYSATFNAWAYKTTDDSNLVGFYNDMTGICQLIGPLFIPIAGIITDSLVKKADKEKDEIERMARRMEAPSFALLGATLFIGATLATKMFKTQPAIYVSLVLIAISRPLVVGSLTSYIRIRFHAEHFNRLNGIFTTIISLLCFFQYPIFIWTFSSDENFIRAHWFLMFLLLLSLSSPIHLMFRSLTRKYAKQQIEEIKIQSMLF